MGGVDPGRQVCLSARFYAGRWHVGRRNTGTGGVLHELVHRRGNAFRLVRALGL
ncbi:hypothetical protein I553_9361 [Mycobacterium xenopi 4042]|uniref:Uncharacterized protein n=1 Tax=Mycobacterium xenopi 4042 TaxID=1299334 RepID=X8E046_MYCXE|nr:hypothetical protein I553_9361 [Mycobacterium xenopi 4042]